MMKDAMTAVDALETADSAKARLRAVAMNAVMEALTLQKRNIITDDDAALCEVIFMTLSRVGRNNKAAAPSVTSPVEDAGVAAITLELNSLVKRSA